MKHAIVTCCDARCGDFLTEHWMRSLHDNVDLDQVDVVVIDYGLSDDQRQRLLNRDVLLHSAKVDGNITNIRYRDIGEFLAGHQYDQVLAVDGGDVIFQADIRHLFETSKDCFRGVCEQIDIPFHDLILPTTDMDKEQYRRIFAYLADKKTINGGMLLGPAQGFRDLWIDFQRTCRSFDVFGTDQLVVNYLLYQQGFVQLDQKYNFVIMSSSTPFLIRQGKFYGQDNELIPVVHNAGMNSFTRCIDRFGYGPQCNRRKRLVPFVLHAYFYLLNIGKRMRLFPSMWPLKDASPTEATGDAE
jgi:hypothetical protein